MRMRKPFASFRGVIVRAVESAVKVMSTIIATSDLDGATDPRLIDTVTKTVHKLTQGTKYLLGRYIPT